MMEEKQKNSSKSQTPHGSRLIEASLNPNVLRARYAVRGRVPIRAKEIQEELKAGVKKPFEKVVLANIGNPQRLNQKPFTFFRQVMALLDLPELMEHTEIFPSDAIERAQKYIDAGVRVGAYSQSQGLKVIREEVADFISERDGVPAEADNIFLTTGASQGITRIITLMMEKPGVGFMIPVPQYPLYSATMALQGATVVPYLLDERNLWGLTVANLEQSLADAKSKGVDVRALCIINPGNPTGQCLDLKSIQEIIRFAHRNRLVLLADEVYQTNSYLEDYPFHSFKKALKTMEAPICDSLELISFHSVSKGTIGECGRRGGYLELTNIRDEVKAQLIKLSSISLCSNIMGQVTVGLMTNPPKPGDASYEKHQSEHNAIFESLKRRAKKLATTLNKLEGVSCNPSMGSMYLFPKITIPLSAVKAAEARGIAPDELYCLELLEETGICVVPGSGFKQEAGTFHFRTTFLAPEDEIEAYAEKIQHFHDAFMARNSDGKRTPELEKPISAVTDVVIPKSAQLSEARSGIKL